MEYLLFPIADYIDQGYYQSCFYTAEVGQILGDGLLQLENVPNGLEALKKIHLIGM